jgi:ABC-2 type transport system permease protein
MNRLIASIKKEILVLIRDWAGLGLIFLMPVALVLVMTLIQDASFRKLDETKITLLYLDNDHDTLGIKVREGLEKAGYFEVVTGENKKILDEKSLLKLVADGKYQMGVVVREGSTEAIRERGQRLVQQTLEGADAGIENDNITKARIVMYFDPVIRGSVKVTIRNALENFTSRIEAGILFQSLSKELVNYLPEPPGKITDPGGGIEYEEIYATDQYTEIIPNSVQHNVPAWTIFAMFFIIIPLTGNIIREKESGLATRLRLLPGSPLQSLGAKVVVYLGVGIVQFMIILLFAKLVFPLLDLPPLVLGPEKIALLMMAVATALAAVGYSVLVGTIARTHDQAAVFGMVSVIILAAIGGIWVPVFMMTNLMQSFSHISPLNWSLDGFYDILLRGAGISGIIWNFTALIVFFIVNLGIAVMVNVRTVRR